MSYYMRFFAQICSQFTIQFTVIINCVLGFSNKQTRFTLCFNNTNQLCDAVLELHYEWIRDQKFAEQSRLFLRVIACLHAYSPSITIYQPGSCGLQTYTQRCRLAVPRNVFRITYKQIILDLNEI
ncbi:Hypothetical_protein [Hexamita inflata]|uniref:Hypothetical_protein n=1 Tax=Hexamita inflata TaxID=28002 RepID=A0AA86QY33_9EUKA|nr:Hypothetical protein HINF_LOCUS55836 [Hexamita inflata]